MVAIKSYCEREGPNKGKLNSTDQCAAACRNEFQMFTFGTNEFGGDVCNSDGKNCECKCMTETEDYKCKRQLTSRNFNLYAITGRSY